MEINDPGPQLGIMVGIPRSGKTFLAKELREKGWARVCPDDIRMALHGGAHRPQAESMVWSIAEVTIRSMLLSGSRVLLDATNVRSYKRKDWYRMAQEHEAFIRVFWVDTPKEVCLERNHGEGAVPEHVINRMHKNLDPVMVDELPPLRSHLHVIRP